MSNRRKMVGARMPYVSRREATRRKARSQGRYAMVTARRSFVPRALGPFSVTEKKYFDTGLYEGTISAGSTWASTEVDPATKNCLFCPVEGSDINNRVGRKVTVHKIKIRGFVQVGAQAAQSAADEAAQIRVILFQDMQTNGAQAQGEELMATPVLANQELCNCVFQNTANFGRFRVLKDIIVNGLQNANMAGSPSTVIVQGQSQPFKFSYTFKKPVVVRFNATNGGTVADIIDNSFHMLAHQTVSSASRKIYYQCRIVYTDA